MKIGRLDPALHAVHCFGGHDGAQYNYMGVTGVTSGLYLRSGTVWLRSKPSSNNVMGCVAL